MIKNKILINNQINFIYYFIIKKDREKIGEDNLKNTKTIKILHTKNKTNNYTTEMFSWVKNVLKNKKLIIIPFPSTNKNKKESEQISFILAEMLENFNKKWVNGKNILIRKKNLPKNTRNVKKQMSSLYIKNSQLIKNNNIIILDDVVTSGSSLKAAIKLIRKEKPKSVMGLALAKKTYIKNIPITGTY